MAGAVRRVGLAVEPPGSAHLRPAWPPANPPTRPTSPLQTATATVTLGWVRTSQRVQIDAAEHRTGSADHVRRWNHPGMLAAGPWGRPRTDQPYGSRGSARQRRRFQTEATVLVRWYRWPLLSIGEADPVLWGGGTGPGWVSPARVAARGRCDGGPQPASAGASKPKSRRSTFGYIVKPEVVAIGGRRCGHHRSTAGRDANAVACRMDCAGRLWVAISVAWSGCLTGARGRTSKLTIYVNLNIGSPCGPGSCSGSVGSGGAHWGGL